MVGRSTRVYFTSERDGFRCLYSARFDPATARVLPSEPLFHMHGTRRSIIATSDDPTRIDVAGNRLVFSLQGVIGNVRSLTPR